MEGVPIDIHRVREERPMKRRPALPAATIVATAMILPWRPTAKKPVRGALLGTLASC